MTTCKWRCLGQRPYRDAKNRSINLTPGRGVRQRFRGTLTIRQQPFPRSPTSGSAASEPPCNPPGEGERRQGQEKGQDPLLCWREGYKQSPHQKRRHLNVGPSPTSEHTGRPKDDETHPEDGPEKRSHEPNSRNPFTRDQGVRT